MLKWTMSRDDNEEAISAPNRSIIQRNELKRASKTKGSVTESGPAS